MGIIGKDTIILTLKQMTTALESLNKNNLLHLWRASSFTKSLHICHQGYKQKCNLGEINGINRKNTYNACFAIW